MLKATLDITHLTRFFPVYSRIDVLHHLNHPNIPLLTPPLSPMAPKTTAKQANEAMWVAKEKAGDNSLDFVAVPVPTTPPASPPLPSRTGTRRSSLIKAMQIYRSGPSPGGGGEGVEQETAGDGRANRNESTAGSSATTAVAAVGTPLSTAGEEGAGGVSCKTLEDGRVRRTQDDASSMDLLVGVGPCESGRSTDAEAAARDTTSPSDDREDDGECDGSRSQRTPSRLEKIFSSSTDLTLRPQREADEEKREV